VAQPTEEAHPNPVVTQVGWKVWQRVSVLLEFNASEQILGVHVPEAEILPVAIVLQGPSEAVNLAHFSNVPLYYEQVLG